MKDLNVTKWESDEDKAFREVRRQFNEEKRYWAINIALIITLVLITYSSVSKFL